MPITTEVENAGDDWIESNLIANLNASARPARTFFRLFLSEIEKRQARSVCVAGASEGKFVPLARPNTLAGWA
jgi:hypothetical protein